MIGRWIKLLPLHRGFSYQGRGWKKRDLSKNIKMEINGNVQSKRESERRASISERRKIS